MPGADFLQLDRDQAPALGLTEWLVTALRSAVAEGRLPVGARLPSTRALAGELAVSRGVVVEAYQRLVDQGLAVGRRGGGTVVSGRLAEPATAAAVAAPVVDLDLSPGLPDLSAFPRSAWLRAEREALAGAGTRELGYGDPRGALRLREALTRWLTRTRGVHAGPDDLIVVGGVAQGLALVSQVLRTRGTTAIGFEEPGSRGTRDQVRQWGLDTPPVPVDEEGLDVDALTACGLETILVTPAHQFPTGVVLSPERRRTLLAWAAEGGLVVEDDYDAEHRYDRAPVAALQGSAPESVVYLGSVSKTLAPALRLGWVVPPRRLYADLVELKRITDLGNPTLPQLALASLLGSGAFERHLRHVRTRQRHRRDAMLDELRRRLPQATVHGVAAGLHLLVTLPDGADDADLAQRALEAGLKVHPLSYHRQLPGPPGLVLGYAAQPPDRIREGVRRLADIS